MRLRCESVDSAGQVVMQRLLLQVVREVSWMNTDVSHGVGAL